MHTPIGRKLYLFEMHRGHDAKRVVEQIKKHSIIIRKGLAMRKYKFEKNNRVIVLFEKRRTQLAAMSKLQEEGKLKDLANYFIFKNLEESEKLRPESFYQYRSNIKGEQVALY